MSEDTKQLTIPAGTMVSICGWPVDVVADTVVVSTPANIELVTRDLYLRRQTPLGAGIAEAVDARPSSSAGVDGGDRV